MRHFLLRISIIFLSVQSALSTAGQTNKATVSGIVKNAADKSLISFASVTLKADKDSSFISGTISNEHGRFTLTDIKNGVYILHISITGFTAFQQKIIIGTLNGFYDLGMMELQPNKVTLNEITITGKPQEVSEKMDKKSFSVANNIAQSGGSVLQVLKNLPGITVNQEGKVELRGSDKVAILIDGKQTALTGFGNQTGLDNIPASNIERIEIINNPSAKYDANGNAGIINIIYKKTKQEGLNGKLGLATGVGAIWLKKENLPGIRPQYQRTPKINPSVLLNYRKKKTNLFLQSDWLYTETLNKNEFVDRFYNDGTVMYQQTKRNRNTHFFNNKAGVDWNINSKNIVTVSGFYGIEKIIDRGDQPFLNSDFSKQLRLWQFLEDELKTTVVGAAQYEHQLAQAGHYYRMGFNYTFHREDEKYFFTNILPTFTGLDSFSLISDEHVADFTFDYVKPLKRGRFETGLKFRYRTIPTNMQFKPGLNSPLDISAGGAATYTETIPAVYGTYIYESKRFEAEVGLRVEYVKLDYFVNPDHNTYKSDGYNYTQPFPNVRFGYKLNENNKLSLFYHRRVDRPNEVDIRIFPKYDDAEIIKVGNPALQPQFTSNMELGYKTLLKKGYFYSALFYRSTSNTITRIATQAAPSPLIYTVFQNAGTSSNKGMEIVFQQDVSKTFSFNTNATVYHSLIYGFTVQNKYPVPSIFTALRESITSGNIKLNGFVHLPGKTEVQFTAVYLAADLLPQGRIDSRFSVDAGLKKQIQKGKGEWFINGTDLFNTLRIKKNILGNGFRFVSTDYWETQVFRVGYSYKF